MWTPPALWNHLADGFEHRKLEQVVKTKEFETTKIGVEEGVDLNSRIIDLLLPNLVL